MIDKLERKYGKYYIPRLPLVMVAVNIIGYILENLNPQITAFLMLDPHLIITRFQFWRIITWILIPPPASSGVLGFLFAAIMLFFYYQLGNMLERTWGSFKFTLYILGGVVCNIVGAFVLYGIVSLALGYGVAGLGMFFSTYYISMSIFLAFAMCYPDQVVMLYFIFPLKIKYLAYFYVLYAVFGVVHYVQYGWIYAVCYLTAIVCSLANFLVFYLTVMRKNSANRARMNRFRQEFAAGFERTNAEGTSYKNMGKRDAKSDAAKGVTRHRCAVCGRSENDGVNLEFRFCSKCNGNYEYCQEHLFTHKHVE